MKSDFQISNECEKKHIAEVAGKLGIKEEDLILYGNHKAKIQTKNIKKDIKEDAKLVLVTSINPTSSGEGKSTVTIGLSDGLNRIGKKSCVALREPSLGPVMGIKVPFIVNPSLNVQLRQKDNAIDRTGHALVPKNDIDVFHIYGRYILIGSDILRHNEGFYEPTDGTIALSYLMEHIKENGDNKLVIKWL